MKTTDASRGEGQTRERETVMGVTEKLVTMMVNLTTTMTDDLGLSSSFRHSSSCRQFHGGKRPEVDVQGRSHDGASVEGSSGFDSWTSSHTSIFCDGNRSESRLERASVRARQKSKNTRWASHSHYLVTSKRINTSFFLRSQQVRAAPASSF